jgi:hypothetical protein
VLGWLKRWGLIFPKPQTGPDQASRIALSFELAANPNLGLLDYGTAEAVLAVVTDTASRVRDANRTIEQKANTFAGISAALIALVAGQNALLSTAPKPVLMIGVALFFASIVLSVFINFTASVGMPGVAVYNLPSILQPDRRALIASKNVEAWSDYVIAQARIQGKKAVLLRWEMLSFLVAMALISVAAVIAIVNASTALGAIGTLPFAGRLFT